MTPALSVVLAARDGFDAVRRTVRHLQRQAVAGAIELVVVGVGGPVDIPPADAAPFFAVRTATIGHGASIAAANAEGVRHASAAVVAFGEDHCFPDPGWAAALIDAHRAPHAAVGPVFRNANPRGAVSWCDFLIGYGPWMEPVEAGLRSILPGHNSSYKRLELLAYGDRLAEALESEAVLHYDLGRRGRTLFLEPRARVAHLNFARLSVWIPVQLHCGRVFAAARAAGWCRSRRLFYAAASPLIPFVRFLRVCRELRAPGRPAALMWRIWPMLACGLAADGLGQGLGYLRGPGRSVAVLSAYEYNRVRFISDEDVRALDTDDA